MYQIGLVALEAFDHHGQLVVPGEVFQADPRDATALRYSGKAMVAAKAEAISKGAYRRRDLVAERP